MYYCLAKEGRAETTDQELVAYLMKEIENEFSGLYSDIIPPSPVYLFGFCAGYTQEYLKTRLEK
jgi:hypothetical protein